MATVAVPPYATASQPGRTVNGLLYEARVLLQDLEGIRYLDEDLLESFNGALAEARYRRPDLFLTLGLRAELPVFTVDQIATPATAPAFPLTTDVYTAFLYYIVGRSEMRDDTFSVDGRAVALMNKFTSALLGVAS